MGTPLTKQGPNPAPYGSHARWSTAGPLGPLRNLGEGATWLKAPTDGKCPSRLQTAARTHLVAFGLPAAQGPASGG